MTAPDRGRDYYAWRTILIASTAAATLFIVAAAVTGTALRCAIAAVWVLIAAVAFVNVRKRSRL